MPEAPASTKRASSESRPEPAGTHRGPIARALSWTVLESLGLSGLSFLSLLIFARFLTPSDFGIASMALGIVQVLNIPVEMLFHDALIQRKEAGPGHFNTAFTVSAVLGLVLCMICWVGAPAVAATLGAPLMTAVLPWMSLSLPLMGLGSAIIAYQRRQLLYRPLAVRSLVGRLTGAAAGIAVAMAGGGVWSLVVQQVTSVGLATAALWLGCNWRPRPFYSAPELKELLTFGLPAMSVMGLYFVGQRWFMLLVGRQLGAEAAGYLNLAFRSIDSLRDVSAGAVSQLALPLFSRHQHHADALAASFNKATSMSCTLMFPLFGSLAICAPGFVHLLFGAKWSSATPLIALMAVLTAHYFSRMFAAPLMSAVRKPHYPLPGQISQLIVITALMLAAGHTSAQMAALIWALRLLVSTPIDIWFMKKATGLSVYRQLSSVPAPLVSAIVMMAIEWQVQDNLPSAQSPYLALAAVVSTGLASYFIILYFVNARLCRDLWHFAQLVFSQPRSTASNMRI